MNPSKCKIWNKYPQTIVVGTKHYYVQSQPPPKHGLDDLEAEKFAAHIVRCVNANDALVNAMLGLMTFDNDRNAIHAEHCAHYADRDCTCGVRGAIEALRLADATDSPQSPASEF